MTTYLAKAKRSITTFVPPSNISQGPLYQPDQPHKVQYEAVTSELVLISPPTRSIFLATIRSTQNTIPAKIPATATRNFRSSLFLHASKHTYNRKQM